MLSHIYLIAPLADAEEVPKITPKGQNLGQFSLTDTVLRFIPSYPPSLPSGAPAFAPSLPIRMWHFLASATTPLTS